MTDFFLPPQCLGCREWIGDEGAVALCGDCQLGMSGILTGASCELCAMPVVEARSPCPHCSGKGVRPFGEIVSLGVLRDPLKKIIHRVKYERRWAFGEWLADCVLDRTLVGRRLGEIDCVVPVPLHWRKHVGRGFNQAEVIARRLGWRLGVPTVMLVKRVRDTGSQAQLKAREKRFENLRGAFEVVMPGKIAGKRVLVVDDVMTTGATMMWMGRALKAAGPASLKGFVAAVADPKGRAFEVI